jgi:hypothetical protein
LQAEEARIPNRADGLPVPRGAQRVRTVFDDDEAVPSRDLENRLHVARQPVEVGRDDRARARRDDALDRAGIDRERSRVHIGKDRREAGDASQLGNHPERQRGKDDLRTLRQVERLQQIPERHATVRRGDRVARACSIRECSFEIGDLRPRTSVPRSRIAAIVWTVFGITRVPYLDIGLSM